MAPLFKSYRSAPFAPTVTDAEWDRIGQSITDNRKDIDMELISIALSFLSTQPTAAALVPRLAAYYRVAPSPDIKTLTDTFESVLKQRRNK